MQVFNYEPVFKQEPINEPKIAITQSREKDLKIFKNDQSDVMNFEFKPPVSVADNYRQKKLEYFKILSIYRIGKENKSNNIQIDKNSGPKLYAGGRTKEEILAQRREMMKPKRTVQSDTQSQPETPSGRPNLERLAKGEKLPVDKKEMLKLTKKNYDDLPEVKKRREEDAKKQEYKDRMLKIKENESKRREMVRNKQY